MRRATTWMVFATITTALVACLGAEADDSGPTAVSTWSVGEAAVRIGAVDDPDYAFGAVLALTVGPDGSVYSLHANEAAVRRWTPEGAPGGTIGREGEGPGEFQHPRSLGFMGDSLWVMDTRTYRGTFFTPEGELIGSVTPRVELGGPQDGQMLPPRPVRPLRDGTWLSATPGVSNGIASGDLTRGLYVRTDVSGRTLDTLWVREWRARDTWAILRDGGGSFMDQPFGDEPLMHAFDHGGLVVVERRVAPEATETTFGVLRIDGAGDTVAARRIAYAPIPLPPSVTDSILDVGAQEMFDFMEMIRPGGASLGQTREAMAATFYTPAQLPAVDELVVALDGSLWLKRQHLDDARNEWWVLDGDGAVAATVELPAGFRLRAVHGAALWGTVKDELDVSYIVRYPLVRPPPIA